MASIHYAGSLRRPSPEAAAVVAAAVAAGAAAAAARRGPQLTSQAPELFGLLMSEGRLGRWPCTAVLVGLTGRRW